jgi:hypothetical protein
MGGVVLRCTAKMLSLLGARPRDLVTIEPSDQDWYANLLWLDGRKCLLLAHAGTLFSVFVPNIRKADLLPIGRSVIGSIQAELGPRTFRWIDSAFSTRATWFWRRQTVAPFWAT